MTEDRGERIDRRRVFRGAAMLAMSGFGTLAMLPQVGTAQTASAAVSRREPAQAHQPDQDVFRAIRSEDMRWQAFPAFPARARLAVLVGDPAKPGPYLIRVHLPNGVRMMPHWHAEDRIYTVISGVFYIGLGEAFDETKLTAHAPGTVLVLPAGQTHFHLARSGDYITQVSAIGPLGLSYVDSTDDPRRGGQAD